VLRQPHTSRAPGCGTPRASREASRHGDRSLTESLDPAALEKLRELERRGNAGVVGRIVDAFLEDAPVKVDTLRRAVDDNDLVAVSMVAHTLKGGCGYVGATRLADLCAEVESAAESGDVTEAGAGIEAIEGELATLTGLLNEVRPAT
jgi:HPt (histidine-containing phosphotransfer) domain-containing protein